MTTPHQQQHPHPSARPRGSRPPRGPGQLVELTTVASHWLDLDATDDTLSRSELIDRLWIVAADVPVLLAEIERTHRLLRIARRRLANLLAATRAALAAAAEGDLDPISYLLDELDARDPLPRPGGGGGM